MKLKKITQINKNFQTIKHKGPRVYARGRNRVQKISVDFSKVNLDTPFNYFRLDENCYCFHIKNGSRVLYN